MMFFIKDMDTWILDNLKDTNNTPEGIPWNVYFSVAYWLMWRWRNERIFTNRITYRRCGYIRSISKAFYKILNVIFPASAQQRETKWVSWMPPNSNKVKLNTDRALSEDRITASARGIIRDEDGKWLSVFVMNIVCC